MTAMVTPPRQTATRFEQLAYWLAIGLFCLILAGSAIWNLTDPAGGRLDYLAHGYPGYVVYPVAIAKLTGLAVILSRRSRTLTDMAFAAFMIDLVLAIVSHVANPDLIRGAIAVATLIIILAAFALERRRYLAAAT
jgi:DoxX-like family